MLQKTTVPYAKSVLKTISNKKLNEIYTQPNPLHLQLKKKQMSPQADGQQQGDLPCAKKDGRKNCSDKQYHSQ